GQSIDVDTTPDNIDVVDEDDDIIDEDDPIPYDLAHSDDEDLVNLDIHDGVNVVYSNVARGHDGDGGGDDRPHSYQGPTGCKGTRKPNLGGRRAGRLHTRQETRNLRLKPSRIKMETSATREYPSLIHTFFLTLTIGGVFLNPKDKALYSLGSNTPTGVPYTEDEIMAIVRGGKQRGLIPDVGRVLPGQGTVIPPPSQGTYSVDIARLKKREKLLTKQVNMFMRLFRSDDKFSQMLKQLESQPEYGGGSGSGGCGDDEPGDDKDGGEDEDDS
nr:hypothetical protein [Tanacetum cinerariifolium]